MEKPTAKETEEAKEKESVTISKEEYEKLLAQVKAFEAMQDKMLRTAADYDNARKRLAKEREEFVKFSQEILLRELLPSLDNFERALSHGEGTDPASSGAAKSVVAGVRLTWKQLLGILEAHGLRRFSAEGEPFDPHRHEVVEEVAEPGPEGVVAKEILSGYLLYDRLLRPAKVCVRVAPGKAEKKEAEKEEELT